MSLILTGVSHSLNACFAKFELVFVSRTPCTVIPPFTILFPLPEFRVHLERGANWREAHST